MTSRCIGLHPTLHCPDAKPGHCVLHECKSSRRERASPQHVCQHHSPQCHSSPGLLSHCPDHPCSQPERQVREVTDQELSKALLNLTLFWIEGRPKGKTPTLSWKVCQALGFKCSGSLAPLVQIAGSKALWESLE